MEKELDDELKALDDELKALDTSLNKTPDSIDKFGVLGHKARVFTALTAATVLGLFTTSCSEKSDYEQSSDRFIKAQSELKEATQEKKEANKNYEDAVREYRDAKRDLKQEAEAL